MVSRLDVLNIHIRDGRERLERRDSLRREYKEEVDQARARRESHDQENVSRDRKEEIAYTMAQLSGLNKKICTEARAKFRSGEIKNLARYLIYLGPLCGTKIIVNGIRRFDDAEQACFYQEIYGVGEWLFDVTAFERLDILAIILKLHIRLHKDHGVNTLLQWLTPVGSDATRWAFSQTGTE